MAQENKTHFPMEEIVSTVREFLQNQAPPYQLELTIWIRNDNANNEDCPRPCLCQKYGWSVEKDEPVDGIFNVHSTQTHKDISTEAASQSSSIVKVERQEVSKKTRVKQEVTSSTTRIEQTSLIASELSNAAPSISDFMPTEINILQNQNSETNLQICEGQVNNSRTEVQFQSIHSTLVELCSGIKKIEENRSPSKEQRKRLPTAIRKVANKYQHAFAYAFIRQFGRLLQLDDKDLDEVEQYSAYGTKEVFWQTIRMWLENSDSHHMTVSYLMTALSECGVNLKDKGKQMSNADKTILRGKMATLMENIKPVESLIPYLCSRHLLCEVTKAYVIAPKTSDLKINRLVDILMTKENGLIDFCSVLRDGGYSFIADEIEEERSASVSKPAITSRLSSSSSSTSYSSVSLRESPSDSAHLARIAAEYKQTHSSSSSIFRKGSDTSISTTAKVAAVSPQIQRKLTSTSGDITIKAETDQERSLESDKIITNETTGIILKEDQRKCVCNLRSYQNEGPKQKSKHNCCVLM
ncbi:uncharacterized protein LOC125675809 isoform X2 [Ostrea edulis]|uniref:uncharacterized protein LOC125675809 isoform X2 n=1 Tax=Ostrea edulis TaxID=37623 RepID=UPI0020956A23|nr:uncharacterized protein LOC125675809 isoform X2 [Ostrea edulis]